MVKQVCNLSSLWGAGEEEEEAPKKEISLYKC